MKQNQKVSKGPAVKSVGVKLSLIIAVLLLVVLGAKTIYDTVHSYNTSVTDKRNIELTLTTIGYALFRDSVDNEIVRELNEWLEDFTRKNKIKLIDINKELSEDYHLKYEYINDGLHYNGEGEKVLFEEIKEREIK